MKCPIISEEECTSFPRKLAVIPVSDLKISSAKDDSLTRTTTSSSSSTVNSTIEWRFNSINDTNLKAAEKKTVLLRR